MRSGARWIAIVAGLALVVALVLLARGDDAPVGDPTNGIASTGDAHPRIAAIDASDATQPTARLALVDPRAAAASLTVVLRDTDGVPLRGARVVATRSRRMHVSPEGQEAISDATGRARYASLELGSWVVVLEGMLWKSVSLEPGSDVEVTLTVPAITRVEGLVVDEIDAPLAGASVRILGAPGEESREVATSDTDGRFAFDSITLQVALTAHLDGFAPAIPLHVFAAGAEPIPFRLQLAHADGEVRGVTVDSSGRPVAGARVVATRRDKRRWRETSDDLGRFLLDDVLEGELTVDGFAPEHGMVREELVVRTNDTRQLELRLGASPRFEGRVITEDRRPVADAFICVSSDSLAWSLRSVADGSFLLPGLPPGQYAIDISHIRHPPLSQELFTDDGSLEQEFVVLDTPPLRGVVVDDLGAPLADLLVADSMWQDSTLTDADGAFALSMAERGHPISIRSADCVMQPIVWVTDPGRKAGDLRVVVPGTAWPTAFVGASLTRPAGYEAERLCVALHEVEHNTPVLLRGVGRDGTLRLGPVPPGEYSLRTTGIRSRFDADELARFALAPHQHLELGVIPVPAPVVPELRARTSDGRVITELRGRFVARGDHREAIPVGLHEGHTTWQPPLRAGEYRLLVDQGEGYRGIEQLVSLRAGPPNVIELVLQAR